MNLSYLCIKYITQIDVQLGTKDGWDISTVMKYFHNVIALKDSPKLSFFPYLGISWDIKYVGLSWHNAHLYQSDLSFGGCT